MLVLKALIMKTLFTSKNHKDMIMMTPELNPDQFVMLDSLDALKGAIEGSLWGMA